MELALRTLADFHVTFWGQHCQQGLEWLPSYEWFFTTAFAQHLSASRGQLNDVPGGRALLASVPHFERGVTAWLEALPPQIQRQVTSLWQDPAALLQRLAEVPWTVIHGDLGPQHIGLQSAGATERIVCIDWEFVARGPPTVDLVHLVLFQQFDRIPGREYREWAFRSYFDSLPLTVSAANPERDWQMALELTAVLWVLAYGQRHGQALAQVPAAQRQRHPAWLALGEEARLLNEAYTRWLT
jgi:hypothetical protein